MQNERLIEKLNSKHFFARKSALKELKKREEYDNSLIPAQNLGEVNTSVHTYYSFSPYSPTLAAYMAYKNGIKLAGVSDYGTLKACEEFAFACKKLGIASICVHVSVVRSASAYVRWAWNLSCSLLCRLSRTGRE